MIELKDISLVMGGIHLFRNLSMSINPGDRVGLIGVNGSGKTTLLRVILGEVTPDRGSVMLPPGKKTGYLPQELVHLDNVSLGSFLKNAAGISHLENKLTHTEELLGRSVPESRESRSLLKKHAALLKEYTLREGYAFEARSRSILHGLGFSQDDYHKNLQDFSGGWQMKALLASLLLGPFEILLLDEPTNHLDTDSLEWLENYLGDYPNTLVVVSHDRRFLDRVTNRTAELAHGCLSLYRGNYSDYIKDRETSYIQKEKERQAVKKEFAKEQDFIDRFRYKASKAPQVQSRLKHLQKMHIDDPDPTENKVTISFPPCERSAHEVLFMQDVEKHYGNSLVFSGISVTLYRGEKVALVGSNGSGKSTFARLAAGREKPSKGMIRRGERVRAAFFSQESARNLDFHKTVWKEVDDFRPELSTVEKRTLLGTFLFSGNDVNKPIPVLSGGEKARLALVKAILTESNFLILDEPTNHLDMESTEILQEALSEFPGTVLVISHDRHFLDNLAHRILELKNGTLHNYPGNYTYYMEKRDSYPYLQEAPATSNSSSPARRLREAKREEAERRNRIFRKRREIETRLKPVEENIEQLENERESIENDLCKPEILVASNQVSTLQIRLTEIREELEKHMKRWEDLLHELERVEEENSS